MELVRTKLCIPAARSRQIPRLHLLERLQSVSRPGLVLVCAPAGFGKTTLLAGWARGLQQAGVAAGWYSLDREDDAPLPFCAYLTACLETALGPLPELAQTAQLLRSSPQIELHTILPALINAIHGSERLCTLVLDDYHLISTAEIHSALAYLIEHLPENLQLAIGSRTELPVPLSRLRAQGRLTEVRTRGLRFTAEETVEYLNGLNKLDLSLRAITELSERTEGWPAGLQLASLALAGRPDKESHLASFLGSHRFLVDYLLEEVLDRQPEPVQAMLLSTSILERMCAPLCSAVTGESGRCETLLETLSQDNLFVVALDEQGTWYRYHHLFRDFLQTRLQKLRPEGSGALHRAASEWLSAHLLLREAALHAFQAQDWEYAAAFVEGHGFEMIAQGQISAVFEWCSRFPEEIFRSHAMLCILQSWTLVLSFRRENRMRIDTRLQQAGAIKAGMERRQAGELAQHIAIVRSFLALTPDPAAGPNELLELSREILADGEVGEPGTFSALLTSAYAHMALHDARTAVAVLEQARQIATGGQLYAGIAESSFHLAYLAQTQGRLEHAAGLCMEGIAGLEAVQSQTGIDLPALGCLEVALGAVLLEQGSVEKAGTHLVRGIERTGWGISPYYLMTGYTALARLEALQGRSGKAFEHLDRLEKRWPDIAFLTRALRTDLSLRAQPLDPGVRSEAAAWCTGFAALTRGMSPPGLGPFAACSAFYEASLVWMRTQIVLGRPQAALAWLEPQLDLALENGLSGRIIELSLLQALARDSQGDLARALVSIERALQVGAEGGYVRSFDQGAAIIRLLMEAERQGIQRDYARQLLAATAPAPRQADGELQAQPIAFPFVDPLSLRELEILRLIAGGATNQEIAGRLVITLGTVKSHINHILRKLEAHNRTAAVARARELGLLEG